MNNHQILDAVRKNIVNNPLDKTRQMFTENEYGIFIKYDDRPNFNCYVVYDSDCVGFGATPEEALSEYIDEQLHHGPYTEHLVPDEE